MPRASGLDLVRHVRENYSEIEIIVITGFPEVQGAVQALKTGAVDYVTKPFTSAELMAALQAATDKLAARRPKPQDEDEKHQDFTISSVLLRQCLKSFGRSRGPQQPALPSLSKAESGTGKELVARAIHYESLRARAPFVPVNCGAIPTIYSRVSSSATSKAPSPEPLKLAVASSSLLMAALSFLTKSAKPAPICKSSCCGCCRIAKSAWSVLQRCAKSTSASSPPPIATCHPSSNKAASAKTSTFVSTLSTLSYPSARSRRRYPPPCRAFCPTLWCRIRTRNQALP